MKKLILLALVIVAGSSVAENWKEFHVEGERFSVMLPDVPEYNEYKGLLGDKPISIHDYAYGDENCVMGVTYHKINKNYVSKWGNTSNYLNASIESSATSMGGEIVTIKEITKNGHSGRKALISVVGGKFLQQTQLFLVGGSVYKFSGTYKKEATYEKRITKYFDSIVLK